MNILDIIDKKEKGLKVSYEEFKYVVDGFLSGEIKDYQMSAFLTEIDLLGLSDEEVFDLTDIMLNSGEKLDLGIKVCDKHSTGGVGDKTTIVLAPLAAACSVNVAKMSGRGLGHTGGTIDKLESIYGFKTSISLEDFKKQVKEIGIALVGQMGNLVPADKKIYALRDVSGTVDSIALIASSIMSKKLASGADSIIIDLKVGSGALVDNIDEAYELGRLMIKIGKKYNKKVACVLTNMNEPLGYAVGNGLEVLECIDTLKGGGPEDLRNLVIQLGSLMVSYDKNMDISSAKELVKSALDSGRAYLKFKEWIKCQGGDINKILVSSKKTSIVSNSEGYIKKIDALGIGKFVRKLGGGRLYKDDEIDYGVGVVLKCKVGDYVKCGDKLVDVYYNSKDVLVSDLLNCFTIANVKVNKNDLIIDVLK